MHLFITPPYATKTNLFHQSWSLYWLKKSSRYSIKQYGTTVASFTHNLAHNLWPFSLNKELNLHQLHSPPYLQGLCIYHFPQSIREQHFNFSVGFRGDCSFLGCTPITHHNSFQTSLERSRWCISAQRQENVPSKGMDIQGLHLWADQTHCLQSPRNVIMLDGQERSYLTDYMHECIEHTRHYYRLFLSNFEKKFICIGTGGSIVLSQRNKTLKCCCNIVFRFCLKFDSSNKILKSIGKERKR